MHNGARPERSVKLHAKPGAKFAGIAQCSPHSRARGAEQNSLFDAVSIHATSWLQVSSAINEMQLLSCMWIQAPSSVTLFLVCLRRTCDCTRMARLDYARARRQLCSAP